MFSRLRKRKAASPASAHNGRRRFLKLGCERLEDRSLLAVLFGSTGGNANSDLYLVDTTTGATTSIGPIGFAVTGLAVDPATGILYGSTSTRSPSNPGSIITIDKVTGAGTLVGSMVLSDDAIADITFDAAGTLYGWVEADFDDLVVINKATGEATIVGDAGLSTFGSGLADVNGTLFYAGNGDGGALRTVDKVTGLTTIVATLTGAPASGDAIAALAMNPDDGTLFAVDLENGSPNSAALVTINTTTGAITTIGSLPAKFDAIAFDAAGGYPDFGPCSAVVVADPFNPGGSILLVRGTSGNNCILVEPFGTGKTRVICDTSKFVFTSSTFQRIVVIGAAGNDRIVVQASLTKPAELFGDAGKDELFSAKGNDILRGGDADDRMFGGPGHDSLYGDKGVDFMYGQEGNDTMRGGLGNDQIWGEGGNDTLHGEDDNDGVYGGEGQDFVYGGIGNDQVFGDGGNDVVLGESGNDQVYGGAGRDILIGGVNADTLRGEAQDDILIGGTTDHDGNAAALAAILSEWANTTRSYTTRVANIRSGGGSTGGNAFNSSTVDDDSAVDTLWGNSELDWFFTGAGDLLKDKVASELLN
ncbi:MAG: calcium-binding protein [Pirellulaceae bacterium]